MGGGSSALLLHLELCSHSCSIRTDALRGLDRCKSYNTTRNTNRDNNDEFSHDVISSHPTTQISSTYSIGLSERSSEPRRFRLINEVYDDTEEIEIADELSLIGVDEPINYGSN